MMPSVRGGSQRDETYRTCAEGVLRAVEHQGGREERSNEVAGERDDPVREQVAGRDPAIRPGHDNEIVAGEQFGTADDHQDQADGKSEPSQETHDPVRKASRQCRRCVNGRDDDASRTDGGRKDRAEGDKGTAEDAKDQQRYGVHPCPPDAVFLGAKRHGGRQDRIERDELRQRRLARAGRTITPRRCVLCDNLRRPDVGCRHVAPVATMMPMIWTATTFRMVIDGKIMA
jgi:hypothetical protein